jgi:uncharacterized membrane protein (DUF106 family)
MIGIIVVMIVSVIVMYNQHKNYMMDKKRIKELEDMLDRYYKEREQTLKLRLKDKGLID